MSYVIETEGLTKRYKQKNAVDGVSIHVKKGDIYGLIGKNGAGKTTLMRMLLGLCAPSSGSISLFGGGDATRARQRIGSLIEAPGLYRNCTAKENMIRFSILYGAPISRVEELLDLVGLGDVGKKKVSAFSLGMRQRLGIAIALIGDPELLILDEPTSGLDPEGIKDMRELLLKLNRDRGITVLISSHILGELDKIATVYGILNNGRLIEQITHEEILMQMESYLMIYTSDNRRAEEAIRDAFPDASTRLHANALYLYNHMDDVAKINSTLVMAGVEVAQLVTTHADIEEFFLERMGR